MAQPAYPHDITKKYLWWIDRGQIAIAYHDVDDGEGGKLGEYLSPIVGYDAKLTATTIAFVVSGSPDTITDSGNNFLAAGFAADQSITVSSASGTNDGTYTIQSVVAGTITLSGDVLSGVESAATAGEVTITSGTGSTVRLFVTKKAEIKNGTGKFTDTGLTEEPEFPEQYHEAMIAYVIWKGYEKMPNPEMIKLAQYWRGRYEEIVYNARAFANENRVYGPKQLKYDVLSGIL